MEATAVTATLDNPDKFRAFAKQFAESHSAVIKETSKAIDLLVSARSNIISATAQFALIINLSAVEHTWYTYNDFAMIKVTTSFTSHMGAYCTV